MRAGIAVVLGAVACTSSHANEATTTDDTTAHGARRAAGDVHVRPHRDVRRRRVPSGPNVGERWQKISTSFDVKEGNVVELGILSRAVGGCFLVDDAVLHRAP